MKKTCLFFLVVGLTFTALQVATVAAQTGMPGGQCDPNPACVENCCGQCDPNPACVENCCPAGDPAPDTAPAEDSLLAEPAG